MMSFSSEYDVASSTSAACSQSCVRCVGSTVTVSAVGTVGLTRGITPQLGAPAKLLLVLAMLVGRVGVLTFVGSLLPPKVRPAFRYPETTIILN